MKIYYKIPICLICLLFLVSCSKQDSKQDSLSVNPTKIDFPKEGGSSKIIISTNAGSWSLDHKSSGWLSLSKMSGTGKNDTVNVVVSTTAPESRTDTLTITAGSAAEVKVIVTQASSGNLVTLTASKDSIGFKSTADSVSLSVTTSASAWSAGSPAEWVRISPSTGNQGSASVKVMVKDNPTTVLRTATITISAENAPSFTIKVTQKGALFPGYNTSSVNPDATGMTSTAGELAAKINLGWNIGNTLEAIGGETAWGNPQITKSFVAFVKQKGFNAIRLPCSWNQYANAQTAQISSTWLDRVKEVVQYCVDNDMYVLLNIHWDGGWLEENCTAAKQEVNNAKQKAFWEQIATKLRDFDEHLLFASANEPNVSDASQMQVLLSYHQTFVNAVRSTGGKNAYRILVVQGPSTDIEKTNQLMTKLPSDKVPNRMMVEVHYYTPWNFTGMTKDESWGNMFYYWGKDNHSTTDAAHNPTWGEESTVDNNFRLMKTQFVDKGIPVILGEFGCSLRTNLTGDALALHKASRAYYFKYIVQQAKTNGILPFFWDTGSTLDRRNNTVLDQQALDGLLHNGEIYSGRFIKQQDGF